MKDRKSLSIANFNCTFGQKDEPMMEHFQDIVYPAFASDIVREVGESDCYFFDEIKLIEYEENKFVLTGLFIRTTTLEIKSRYEKGIGIKKTNQVVPSDPFSIFIIFLENHRMVLVKNQKKGSPDIRSFSATAKYLLRTYIHEQNEQRKRDERLPYSNLNIVSIPSKKDIIEKLKDVSKIKKVTFKLYPINGDIPIRDTYDSLLKQLNMIGSKTGSVSYNSPSKHSKVAELISKTRGIVDPKLNVEFKKGGVGTLVNDSFSQKIDIELSEEVSLRQNIMETIEFIKDNEDIKDCSNENKKIYLKNIHKIINIFK